MAYEDLTRVFMFLHRTRLFGDEWTVVQQWTNVNISYVTGYQQTKFVVEIKKGGNVVFVLTQLDDRFFQGLTDQYTFELHFLLQNEGAKPGEHLVRARPTSDWESRSVSAEVELEPGRYEVIPKVQATRDKTRKMVDDVVKEYAEKNPQKLNWKTSIVDLMKLLGIDSSLENRKELARELGYTADQSDSASMNIWLHKRVMQELEKNGGKVPASLVA